VTIDDVALRISEALGRAGVPFMLVGSFSSNFHGIPRSTRDADFVVQLSAPLDETFARTLGPEFQVEPQLSSRRTPARDARSFAWRGRYSRLRSFSSRMTSTTRNGSGVGKP